LEERKMYLTIILTTCISQAPVGPLDAFRANLASTKVDVKFVFTRGTASADAVDQLRSWSSRGVAFTEDPNATITGRWACDGAAEMLACQHPALQPAPPPGQVSELKGEASTSGRPATVRTGFEALLDGEIQADHRLGDPEIQVHLGGSPGMI